MHPPVFYNFISYDEYITKVDTVFLSHGHYDHSGGLLTFASANPSADIYMHEMYLVSSYGCSPETADLEQLRFRMRHCFWWHPIIFYHPLNTDTW